MADGRALPFPDACFDAGFSVSVLEHIPDDGDGRAIRELARVLRPGALLAITVPFAQAAHDTFVRGDVYERHSEEGRPVFFERHYDHGTLAARLLGPSELEVERLEIWGEPRLRGERLLRGAGRSRDLLSPLEPALSLACLDPVPGDSPRANSKPASTKSAPKRSASGGMGSHGGAELISPIQGTVLRVAVEAGAPVAAGDLIAVVEAMKMENEIRAHRAGSVFEILVAANDRIAAGAVLARIGEE